MLEWTNFVGSNLPGEFEQLAAFGSDGGTIPGTGSAGTCPAWYPAKTPDTLQVLELFFLLLQSVTSPLQANWISRTEY
jgi:hypothetical protein